MQIVYMLEIVVALETCLIVHIISQIIEFISVLVAVSSDVAEKELIRLGAVERILELFFQ